MPQFQTLDVTFGVDSGFCFKIAQKTADGEGWLLHACKSAGGVISKGAFGTDSSGDNHKVDILELHNNVATKRFKLSLKVADYIVCESFKLKFSGTTADKCHIAGGRDVQTSLAPLREYVPEAKNNQLPDALFWTMVEEAHEGIMKQWKGGKYVAAVDAMNELCNRVCAAIEQLPPEVTGSNQYFSQSIHLMFEFMTSTARVLDVKSAWDVNRLRGPQWDHEAMPKARTRCKAAGKRVAVLVDKRLNPKTRTRLYQSRRFAEYLPLMNAPCAGPRLVSEVEEMGICEDPECARPGKKQVIIKSTQRCGACMKRQSEGVWDSDDGGKGARGDADREDEDEEEEDMSQYSKLDIVFGHDTNCYFRVSRRLPDEAGWELKAQTARLGGAVHFGCEGYDKLGTPHTLKTLEIEERRAKERFGLKLWTGVCLRCDALKVRYKGSTDLCYVVGGENLQEIKAPERRAAGRGGGYGAGAMSETTSEVSVKTTKSAARWALADEIMRMPPAERLRWAEQRLVQYDVDRTTFRKRERVILEDIRTFEAAGREDDVQILQEALWVARDYNNNPAVYVDAPPPPAAKENVQHMLTGLGFAVKPAKGKKRR